MTGKTDHIYLDHSASTPLDPRVAEAMAPYWNDVYGNTESPHALGQAAAGALEQARQDVADVLGCAPGELVFTGSGTEADNLAIRGVAWSLRRPGASGHIVTSPIEHPAVGRTVEQMRDLFGFDVTRVGVDEYGYVDPDEVAAAIKPDTVLVSVMAANNEVGTIQGVAELAEVCGQRGVTFHCDAIQAPGRLPLDVTALGVDLMALSAHKFYGPKGVGLLYARRGTTLAPALTGGGHERGRRPGTVNLAGAVGLATALRLADGDRESECSRLRGLRDQIVASILDQVPDSRLTGHPAERLAHHASFCFRHVEGQSLVLNLDLEGIAVSSSAACAAGDAEPSFVLRAMGIPPDWSIGSLRVTLGRGSTESHAERLVEALPSIVERLRTSP